MLSFAVFGVLLENELMSLYAARDKGTFRPLLYAPAKFQGIWLIRNGD